MMIMASYDQILEHLPEIGNISDEDLRDMVVKVWMEALDCGGCTDLETVPWTLTVPDIEDTLVNHTNRVARLAGMMALAHGNVDVDLVLAGALLHDVGKLLEFKQTAGTTIKRDMGKSHAILGAELAQALGAPPELAHIIAAHSVEGDEMDRSPEAILVHHVDFMDFEMAKKEVTKV